jgi:hypothetical protein
VEVDPDNVLLQVKAGCCRILPPPSIGRHLQCRDWLVPDALVGRVVDLEEGAHLLGITFRAQVHHVLERRHLCMSHQDKTVMLCVVVLLAFVALFIKFSPVEGRAAESAPSS